MFGNFWPDSTKLVSCGISMNYPVFRSPPHTEYLKGVIDPVMQGISNYISHESVKQWKMIRLSDRMVNLLGPFANFVKPELIAMFSSLALFSCSLPWKGSVARFLQLGGILLSTPQILSWLGTDMRYTGDFHRTSSVWSSLVVIIIAITNHCFF